MVNISQSIMLYTLNLYIQFSSVQFSSVQSLSRVWLFANPWTAAHQASLSITNSQSLLKLMSIESVMPSSHLTLCCPLLFLLLIFHSIMVFSNELVLRIRWPKYWSLSFNISPSNEYSGLISSGKESTCQAGDASLIPGSGRSLGKGNGNPLQCSCLENPMDRGAWQATESCKESDTT